MHWLQTALDGSDMTPTPHAMEKLHITHTHRVKIKADSAQVAEFDAVSAHISSSTTAQLLPT